MWFWTSIVFVLVAVVIRPYTGRLQATSLWLGRALTTPELATAAPAGVQSAINDGWPSWLGLLGSVLPLLGIGVGFLHAWWLPLGSLVLFSIGAAVIDRTPIAPVALDHYVLLFLAHAKQREADYRIKGDTSRAEAAEQLAGLLTQIFAIYVGTGVPAPRIEVARSAPAGDPAYLLERAGTATPPPVA